MPPVAMSHENIASADGSKSLCSLFPSSAVTHKACSCLLLLDVGTEPVTLSPTEPLHSQQRCSATAMPQGCRRSRAPRHPSHKAHFHFIPLPSRCRATHPSMAESCSWKGTNKADTSARSTKGCTAQRYWEAGMKKQKTKQNKKGFLCSVKPTPLEGGCLSRPHRFPSRSDTEAAAPQSTLGGGCSSGVSNIQRYSATSGGKKCCWIRPACTTEPFHAGIHPVRRAGAIWEGPMSRATVVSHRGDHCWDQHSHGHTR